MLLRGWGNITASVCCCRYMILMIRYDFLAAELLLASVLPLSFSANSRNVGPFVALSPISQLAMWSCSCHYNFVWRVSVPHNALVLFKQASRFVVSLSLHSLRLPDFSSAIFCYKLDS